VISLGCSPNNFDANERPNPGGDQREWGDFETRWQNGLAAVATRTWRPAPSELMF
jgi:hypothetical protein